MADFYPLFFSPIYQYRMWGGAKLSNWCSEPLPAGGSIGEAWILSDRDDFPSVASNGAFQGKTIKELIEMDPVGMLGGLSSRFDRFPLLLKFLDAREMLSVQVHPSDEQTDLLPPGERGKTEAWVVLEAEQGSRLYAGLRPGTTADDLRHLTASTAEAHLASFEPKPGDGLYIEAGTVHALGGGVVVFEVQENSDVTYRLFDWDRIDAKTGQTRELHIERALRCIDFDQGPLGPTMQVDEGHGKTRLFQSEHFALWRHEMTMESVVGFSGDARVVICLGGKGSLAYSGIGYEMAKGDVVLLPASVGECACTPIGGLTILEVGLPA